MKIDLENFPLEINRFYVSVEAHSPHVTRVYVQNQFYAIFYANCVYALTIRDFSYMRSDDDNSVTFPYRIQMNPAPPIQY